VPSQLMAVPSARNQSGPEVDKDQVFVKNFFTLGNHREECASGENYEKKRKKMSQKGLLCREKISRRGEVRLKGEGRKNVGRKNEPAFLCQGNRERAIGGHERPACYWGNISGPSAEGSTWEEL